MNVFWLFLSLLGFLCALSLQAGGPTEYEVKAAFLCKFADFIEWPVKAFDGTNAPFVIGILGKDPFEGALERIVHGQKVQNRPLEIRRCAADGSVAGCHIVFVSSALRRQYDSVLRRIRTSGLLTVGDGEGFCRAGGIIGFYQAGSKLQFEINVTRARQANFRISSRLLALSRVVEEATPSQ